jgi:hypothetical protein
MPAALAVSHPLEDLVYAPFGFRLLYELALTAMRISTGMDSMFASNSWTLPGSASACSRERH